MQKVKAPFSKGAFLFFVKYTISKYIPWIAKSHINNL